MAMMEDQTEQILWGLLENERYIGATISKSPHRKLMRPRCGSPDEYTTEKTEPLPAPNIPPLPPPTSPRRPAAVHFAAAPSPQYSLPEVPMPPPTPKPAEPPPPSPREIAEATQREQFSRVLFDLEGDLRNRRGIRTTIGYGDWMPPPPSYQPQYTVDTRPVEIYRWHPVGTAPPPYQPPPQQPSSLASPAAAPTPSSSSHRVADLNIPPGGYDGPWLPRWQPAPSREAVSEATERLLSVEAHIHFARRATRKALRTWAFGEDRRPMMRRLRAAVRHWKHRVIIRAMATWCTIAFGAVVRENKVDARVRTMRLEALRSAMVAWRLELLRGARTRLKDAFDNRLKGNTRGALYSWRETLQEERNDFEIALLLTHTFRRWMLLVQTAVLSRLLLKDSAERIEAELNSL